MRVYTGATKRRVRLTAAERKAYDEARIWADMGTSEDLVAEMVAAGDEAENEKTPV